MEGATQMSGILPSRCGSTGCYRQPCWAVLARSASGRRTRARCDAVHAADDAAPSRRTALAGSTALALLLSSGGAQAAEATSNFETMDALKGKDYGKERQRYSDYTRTASGLQFQDIREGNGATPSNGARVSIDWDGYTIGYYAKGGSFGQGADRELYTFTLGAGQAIPAVEEAVASMKVGGIRRLIVPVELGYPDNDFNKKGPKPSTFSGQRALDFVLRNQGLIDKTLLIDVELVKVS